MAVVPQQRGLAAHGLTALLGALEHSQGARAAVEAEVAEGDHAAFHHDQRPLDQL